MIKCIALLKRRDGLSFEEFVDYYETHHAVIARKYLSAALHYQRRFLQPDALSHADSPASKQEQYDCLTELWFQDRAAMEATLGRLAEPEVAAVIVPDEEKFIDRSRIRFFVIDRECTSA